MTAHDATPMFRQYLGIKSEHEDKLLLYRMGDFYELFCEDAERASALLGITLTRRANHGKSMPMAGVPVHSADTYISRLVRLGEAVAVCEQVGEAQVGGSLMDRKVTRIITPGTLTDAALLDERDSCIAMAIASGKDNAGYAWLDLARGELRAGECRNEELAARVARVAPAELLLAEGQPVPAGTSAAVRHLPSWDFEPVSARRRLLEHFNVRDLSGYGLEQMPKAAAAAAALVGYAEQTQCQRLTHLHAFGAEAAGDYLQMDPAARRSLELTSPLSESGPTLLSCIDMCSTSMGSRMLRRLVHHPLRRRDELELRQDSWQAVAEVRALVREKLEGICDVERIATRIGLRTSRPRELAALRELLGSLGGVASAVANLPDKVRRRFAACLRDHSEILTPLHDTLADEPAALVRDGGVVRNGCNEELDGLREISGSLDGLLNAIEARERADTGLASLKVGRNRVHGLYFELPRSQSEAAPERFRRRQTLKHAERYTTQELDDLERRASNAGTRALELEAEIYARLLATLGEFLGELQELATALAELDICAAMSALAAERGWVRPAYADESLLDITDGRHPVVEGQVEHFVANSAKLDCGRRLMILTGPNMGGKSTYMRQIALIALLAHIGAPVPAASAVVGMLDSIHTRIGSADDLAGGRSTFMVEMNEMGAILNTAGERSLVLLDEIGRGTSTFDGLSLAWAAGTTLLRANCSLTLLATHYFELTRLGDENAEAVNYHMAVGEDSGGAVMLHRVEPGPASRSFGIQVARMAGLPEHTLGLARAKLTELEKKQHPATSQRELFPEPAPPQTENSALKLLRRTDPDSLNPREALDLVYELRRLSGEI